METLQTTSKEEHTQISSHPKTPHADVEEVGSASGNGYGTNLPEDERKTIERVTRSQQGSDAIVWGALLQALGVVGLVAGFTMMVGCAFWVGGGDTW